MKFLKRIFLALLVALVTVGCSKEDRRVYLESISIPRTITIEEGQSQKLSVSVLPNGITEEYTILWKCSDNTIASVDRNGNVKAIKAGTTTIIAYEKTKQNIKSECEITVTAKPVKIHSVSFVEAPSSLIEEESTTLIVEVAPENINQPYQLEYASSQTEVATIDNTGNLTAIKAGKTTISVYVKDNSQVRDEFELTVMEKTIPINSVSFKEAPTELVVDGEQDLIVEVAPENVNEPYELIFTSSDQTVATVSETGRLKALKTGKALIGVFVNNNPEINAEFELTVREKPIPIESLSFSTYKETLEEGRTDQISVSVVPDNINVPYKLVYASSEKSVATVSESGLVTAVKAGTTTISVHVESDERIKAEYTLTVTAKKVEIESIAFQDNQTSLEEGETNQTSLKVSPENINQPYKISYKSSDTGVATIDGKGLVTAVKAGQTTISASVEGKDIKTEYFLTVTAKPIELEQVILNESSLILEKDEIRTLTYTVSPSNTNVPYKLVWISSDNRIASIDQTGKITGLKEGQVFITLYVEDKIDIKDICVVTVNDPVVDISASGVLGTYLLSLYDENKDGKLQKSEIKNMTEISFDGWQVVSGSGGRLDFGILKYMPNLKKIDCKNIEMVNDPDFSHNINLNSIKLNNISPRSNFDFSSNKELDTLILTSQEGRPIESVNTTGCSKLKYFQLSSRLYNNASRAIAFDLSTNTAIEYLSLSSNIAYSESQISALQNLRKLQTLKLYGGVFPNKKFNFSNYTELLDCTITIGNYPYLDSMDFSKCEKLEKLSIRAYLESVDISGCRNLTFFEVENRGNSRANIYVWSDFDVKNPPSNFQIIRNAVFVVK